MAVFFAYERFRVLLRVALPLALGIDMVHSFYYVGRLLQEKRYLNAERARQQTLHSTTALFKQVSRQCGKTDYNFWPVAVQERISTAVVPDASSLPKPSYELDDDDGPIPNRQPFVLNKLREWAPPNRPPTDAAKLEIQCTDDAHGVECEKIGRDEGETVAQPTPRWDVGSLVEAFYTVAVPYPVRHPQRFLDAVCAEVSREIRRHIKRSDGYCQERGKWLRTVLHLPFLIVERRSALRFRIRRVETLTAP